MKLIGISGYSSEKQVRQNTAYVRAMEKLGLVPVIIPPQDIPRTEYIDEGNIKESATSLALKLDALLLSGGPDINPLAFGEYNYGSSGIDIARDTTEIGLFDAFREAGKPIIGICRGFQLMGQILGLQHYQQDLAETKETHSGGTFSASHRAEPIHDLMNFGSYAEYLKSMGLKEEDDFFVKTYVNSWHHQGFTWAQKGTQKNLLAIKQIIEENKTEKQLEILSATGAVIEGFRHITEPIFGTQNHPEEYDSSLFLNFFAKESGLL